jgi:hypothetical protein
MSCYNSCEEHERDMLETRIWLENCKEDGDEFYDALLVYVTVLCLTNAITSTILVMAICELNSGSRSVEGAIKCTYSINNVNIVCCVCV